MAMDAEVGLEGEAGVKGCMRGRRKGPRGPILVTRGDVAEGG